MSLSTRSLALVLVAGCSSSTVGTREPGITVNPGLLDFGTVDTSAPVMQPLTITNTGEAPLQIQSINVTGVSASLFTVQDTPGQIAANSSQMLSVTMTPPNAAGLHDATLVITSNAANEMVLDVDLSVIVTSFAVDAGPMDAGPVDAGPMDAGPVDAGPMDAGPVDAGAADAGPVDAGPMDAGPADAGIEDAGPADAGIDDAGPCAEGQMLCPSGQSMVCTDPLSDPENCGTCGHFCATDANLGCVNGMCVTCDPTAGYTTLAGGQGQPYDLVVDSADVYWTAATDGTVDKVGLDGGTPVTLVNPSEFVSPASIQPTFLTVDSTSVYFVDQTEYNVLKVGLNGGTPTTLGGTGAWPQKVAVNNTGVYWVVQTTGAVWASPLDGPAIQLIPAPVDAGSGEQFNLYGLDSTSVYWVAGGSSTNDYLDGAIMKAGLAGGTPTTVASGLAWPGDGTVDSGSVYWANSVDGMILKVSTAGGTPETLATGLRGPRRVVVDDSYVYWSAGGTDSTLMNCSSAIQKVPLNGGPVTDLVFGQYSAYAVAVDATSVYWADLYYGTVMKTPK